MKAFLIAVLILCLLPIGIVLLSKRGADTVGDYLAAMPSAEAEDAEGALGELAERIEEDRLLLHALFSHERADELASCTARAMAAARQKDGVELAILLAELRSLLLGMQRDLAPRLIDVM